MAPHRADLVQNFAVCLLSHWLPQPRWRYPRDTPSWSRRASHIRILPPGWFLHRQWFRPLRCGGQRLGVDGDCYHDSYNGAPADGSAWSTVSSAAVPGATLHSISAPRSATGSRPVIDTITSASGLAGRLLHLETLSLCVLSVLETQPVRKPRKRP